MIQYIGVLQILIFIIITHIDIFIVPMYKNNADSLL